MNLFGINISLAKQDSNGQYVKKEECSKAHSELTTYLGAKFGETKGLIEDLHRRIDDHQKAVMTYIDLLGK